MKQKIRSRLYKKRYLVISGIIISVLTVFISTYLYGRYEKLIRTEKENEIHAISELKVEQISEWMVERTADVKYFSQSRSVWVEFEKWIKNKSDDPSFNQVKERLRLTKENHNYTDMQIISPGCEILFTFTGEKKLNDFIIPFIKQSISEKKIVFTDLYLNKDNNSIQYDILSPLVNDKQEVFAVILSRLNPYDYLYPLIQKWPTPSKTAETIVLRRDGDFVLYLNDLRHKDSSALVLKIPMSQKDLPAVQAALGYEGIFEGFDYRGIRVISDLRKIPNTNWFIVTKIDKDEIFHELKVVSLLFTLFVIVIILMIVSGLVLLYNLRQKGIYRELYIAERKYLQSQEVFRTTLYSIGDAVITTDLNGKVMHMNPVAEELTGWDEQEAIEKLLSEVFNIVNEKTREITENPVEKVLKEGLVAGLENHTLLISKNGKEIPIADSGAPIKNEDGDISGVVIVFRDQTVERKNRNAIEESEAKFRSLFSTTNEGICIHELLLYKGGEPIDYRILDVNRKYEEILGMKREDIVGKKGTEIYQTDTAPYLELYSKVALTGKTESFETYFEPMKKYFDISVYSPEKGKFVTVFQDITERRKMEDALKESEARLNAFAENVPALILIKDEHFRPVYANSKFKELFPFDKWYLKKPHELFHYDVAKKMIIQDTEAMEKGFTEYEEEWKDIFGNVKLYSTQKFRIDIKGQSPLLGAIIIDISKKNQDETLKQVQYNIANSVVNSKNLYELFETVSKELNKVIDARNFFAALYDEETDNLYIPFEEGHKDYIEKWKAEKSLTGLVVKQKVSILLDKEGIKKLADEGTIEYLGERSESWLGVPLKIGQRVLGALVIQDYKKKNAYDNHSIEIMEMIAHELSIYIDHKRAEEVANRLTKGIEQSPICIIVTDVKGNIEYVNPKFTELTGYTFKEINGKNPNILNSGDHNNEYYKNLWDTVLSGKDWKGELHNKKKNGELFWESAIISPIFDEDGKITHFIGIKEDITEKKKMIEDLIIAKNNAEDLNRLKSSFLANMSHELRTPLNGILGFAEILKDDIKDEDSRNMANIIFRSGKRLHNTLNQILDLTTLQSEVAKTIKDNINLKNVVEESFHLYEAEAKKKNLDLKYDVKVDEIILYTDKNILLNTLNNLVDNAIKYTHEGSVMIKLYEEANNVIIDIIDTGIGIEEENLELIFDEFRQVSEGYGRSFEGTGLGLSLCKKYMKLLGGNLKVESKLYKGSTFRIELPKTLRKADKNSNTIQDASGQEIKSYKPIVQRRYDSKLLYVENDLDNQDLVRTVFKDFINIDMAKDAIEGLKMARENQYALILMDINLGSGMNGKELTKMLRKYPQYKDTPIIAVTAFAMEGDRDEFIESGCTDYISKPFVVTEMQSLIFGLLENK